MSASGQAATWQHVRATSVDPSTAEIRHLPAGHPLALIWRSRFNLQHMLVAGSAAVIAGCLRRRGSRITDDLPEFCRVPVEKGRQGAGRPGPGRGLVTLSYRHLAR